MTRLSKFWNLTVLQLSWFLYFVRVSFLRFLIQNLIILSVCNTYNMKKRFKVFKSACGTDEFLSIDKM